MPPPLITATLPTGLPAGLKPVSVVGTEGLSVLPHWTAKFRAPHALPAGTGKLARDKPVTLKLRRPDGSMRTVGGVVNRVSVAGPVLTLELVSRFQWALQHGEDSRVYVNLSPAKVLARIFTDRGVRGYLTVHGSVAEGKPRPHTVTFKESPLRFALRLMEEQGWYFRVDHTPAGEKLVVGDGQVKEQFAAGPPVRVVSPADEWPGPGEAAWVEPWTESRAGGGVETNSFHWETPRADLSVSKPGANGCGRPRPGVYEWACYATAEDGKLLAKRRAQRAQTVAAGVSGASGCVKFAPGVRVKLNGKGYLLTAVRHEAIAGDGNIPPTYRNRFDAVRSTVTFRPPLTVARPQIVGKLPGVVVGADGKPTPRGGGPDVLADRWGRVRVRLAFDRPHPDGEDTAVWVRAGQVWAGDGFGGLFLPPIGSELTVAFEGGDPDRPELDSVHHNPAARPPVDPSAEPYQFGLWGRPGQGKVPASKLTFDDRPGKERADLSSRGLLALLAATAGEIDCGEKLTLKVGKSNITLTPDGIVLAVGGTTVKLTEAELWMIAGDIYLN